MGHRHCVYCGTETGAGGLNPSSQWFAAPFGKVTRSLAGIARWVIPERYLPYLLTFGLLAITAAQLVFNLGKPQELPAAGVFAMLVGIGAVAWWTASGGRSMMPRSRVDGAPSRVDWIPWGTYRNRTPRLIVLCASVVLLGVLLFRVWSGHDNTWDVGLWLLSLAAFATPFVPGRYWAINQWQIPYRTGPTWEFAKQHWRGALPLLAILIVFCAAAIPNLTAWRYAALGDEYLFYEHARSALESGTTKPFSQNGVYDHHPVLSTLYKAAWMAIFGDGHIGWKMTGVVSMIMSICGMFALGSFLGVRRTAVASAGLFAVSHYLFGLLHGGYNHLDALPITIWALVAFVLGLRNKDPWPLFLAGVCVGIGLHFHYSARIVGPVMLLAAIVSVHPRDWLRLWPVVAGFALAAWPTLLLAQGEILTKMIQQTPAGYSPVVVGSAGERLITNISLNLPAPFFNASSHTYVGGSLLDPLSGAFAAVGLGLALATWDKLASKLCLIWLAVAFLGTGLTSPYPTTAITRLFPMVPPLALLAGLAIPTVYNLTAERVRQLPIPVLRAAGPIMLTAVLVAALCLNQYRALVGTHDVFHYTRESLAVGAFRSPQCEGDLERTVFAGVNHESTLSKALKSYAPDGRQAAVVPFSEFDIADPLPEPGCVIIHDADSREARWAKAQLQERYPSGTFYTYTTPSGKSSVEFFHIPRT